MLVAGLMFDLGILLISAAWNFAMLLTGRLLLGAAVALAAVAVTLYNSEMAPAHLRGVLNQLFQVRGRVQGFWSALQTHEWFDHCQLF